MLHAFCLSHSKPPMLPLEAIVHWPQRRSIRSFSPSAERTAPQSLSMDYCPKLRLRLIQLSHLGTATMEWTCCNYSWLWSFPVQCSFITSQGGKGIHRLVGWLAPIGLCNRVSRAFTYYLWWLTITYKRRLHQQSLWQIRVLSHPHIQTFITPLQHPWF